MTSSNNPRFRLLVGWCCLMTSALLVMVVYLAAKKPQTNMTRNSEENNTKPDHLKGSPSSPSFIDFIHIIRDTEKIWICSESCESSSFSLNNGTVNIKTSGFYYIHAQVKFKKSSQQTKTEGKKPGTVYLIKNKGPTTQQRKLSEVASYEPGSLTMIRMVTLTEGESISLHILNGNLLLSNEYFDTYWEIFLYNK